MPVAEGKERATGPRKSLPLPAKVDGGLGAAPEDALRPVVLGEAMERRAELHPTPDEGMTTEVVVDLITMGPVGQHGSPCLWAWRTGMENCSPEF
jgi:hypothetical protein